MAGLCYDTPPVEARPFPVAMPDKTPWVLSEDFYQEKLPYKPLAERFPLKQKRRSTGQGTKNPLTLSGLKKIGPR
jgi:hypothetical protein